MKLLRFFVIHSLRDMWRNRSRTVFALVCVATGVAAVVGLRSLAFMVRDELTSDLAQMNRGDIRIYASRDVPELVKFTPEGDPVFTRDAVAALRDWAAGQGAQVTEARMTSASPLRRITAGAAETPKIAFTFYVDPARYPFYDTITLQQPAGMHLADVFGESGGEAGAAASVLLPKLAAFSALAALPGSDTAAAAWALYPGYLLAHPRPIVISSNLARESGLGLRAGDLVRVGAAEALYRVSGIAPSSSESILANPQILWLEYRYVYLPLSDLPLLGDEALPDQVFVKVPAGRDASALETNLIQYLTRRLEVRTNLEKQLNRSSVAELEKQNSQTADVIDDMILVMGLSSLLIGGIGIINTMLVVVSRRTLEIAVLKTLGLKAYRVTGLFLVEAALMGLLGSLIGIAVGVLLSYLIRGVGEEAFALALEWRLYPAAMLSGLFLGLVITVLFGFLPTLIAGQVRPAVVLRPNEAQMPAAGLIQTLVTVMVMITVLGLLVDTIVKGAVSISPVIMLAGAGALIGLFAGVIIANAGIGRPIPAYYVFHLPRRFERLEDAIAGGVGRATAWIPWAPWRSLERGARGRQAVTLGLRTFRQAALLYGALAIGAALASGVVLIVTEMWLPAGLGTSKPANDVLGAWHRGDAAWVLAWIGLTLSFGLLIRLLARSVAGLIALATLGITLGGLSGWGIGRAGATVLAGTGVWEFLGEISTGIVLVEGVLALLGAIFIGYWLLVWAVTRLPGRGLMLLVGLVLVLLLAAAAVTVARIGGAALIGVAGGAAALGLLVLVGDRRRGRSTGALPMSDGAGLAAARTALLPAALTVAGVAGLAAGFLALDALGLPRAWSGVILGGAALIVLWRVYLRRYRVDGRLILREMAGRRNRVASTLLGLSVGIAGLSVVSLTTNAVTRILEIQLGSNAEGNLLVLAREPSQQDAIRDLLNQSEGVEHFAQFATYRAVLLEIDGKPVVNPHAQLNEDQNPAENSNFDMPEQGTMMFLSQRPRLDDLPRYDMVAGRRLGPEDVGKNHMLIRESFFTEELNITSGSRLMFLFENGPGRRDDVMLLMTVVGVIARQSEQSGFSDQFLAPVPPGTLPGTITPIGVVTIAQIDESSDVYMDHVLVGLANLPGVIPVELSALTQLVESLLNQMKAIPTLVAWLALVAGTAIIANTVALATQERRRQIGVMKAVGLKGRRVLGMLVIENGLIGLIAGLIGIGVGLLITIIIVLATPSPTELRQTISAAVIVQLVLMSIAVAIGAATLSAWSAAAEKPMNVLRYE